MRVIHDRVPVHRSNSVCWFGMVPFKCWLLDHVEPIAAAYLAAEALTVTALHGTA